MLLFVTRKKEPTFLVIGNVEERGGAWFYCMRAELNIYDLDKRTKAFVFRSPLLNLIDGTFLG
jgi:hypothetical protein